MINTRAAGDARHARTGKDGAFYQRRRRNAGKR